MNYLVKAVLKEKLRISYHYIEFNTYFLHASYYGNKIELNTKSTSSLSRITVLPETMKLIKIN